VKEKSIDFPGFMAKVILTYSGDAWISIPVSSFACESPGNEAKRAAGTSKTDRALTFISVLLSCQGLPDFGQKAPGFSE